MEATTKPTPYEIIDAAVIAAAADFTNLDTAVAQVMRVFDEHGYKTIDDGASFRWTVRREVLRAVAKDIYAGDAERVDAYVAGYFYYRSVDGANVGPLPGTNVEAWEAGRAANPEYASHLLARVDADTVFRGKFNSDQPTTNKGILVWRKAYRKALNERLR